MEQQPATSKKLQPPHRQQEDKNRKQQPPATRGKKQQPLDKDNIQQYPTRGKKQQPPNKDKNQELQSTSQKQQAVASGKKQKPLDLVDMEQQPAMSKEQQPPDKDEMQQPLPSDKHEKQQLPYQDETQQPVAASQNQQPPDRRRKQRYCNQQKATSQMHQLSDESQSNLNEETPVQGKKSTGNQYWIKNLCPFIADKEILESPTLWLSDSVIYAASVLLAQQAKEFDGWQIPQCGKHFQYKPVNPRQRFIQILHDNGHWITVSNIDIHEGGVTDSINVFDSFQTSDVSLNTKKQVCAMIKSNSHEVKFDIINIMPQPNCCDRGAFVIVCVTELVYGFDPSLCCWNVALMRRHLLSCFESGKMIRFPITKTRRVPFGRRVKYMVSEKVYCVCRMPNERLRPMIQCENCFEWFHFDCIDYDSSLDWKCTNCVLFLRNTISEN